MKAIQFKDRGDWRTLALLILTYSLWIILVFGTLGIPSWLLLFIIAPILTFHSSLQHEVLHGHPFNNQKINDLLVMPSLGVFVPYTRFKDTHLKHHCDARLCDPYDDPESWYQGSNDWHSRSGFVKGVFNFNNTLLGRLLLGPAIAMIGFVRCDFSNILKGQLVIALKWSLHFILVAVILSAVHYAGNINVFQYLIACYIGFSLLMVRTFLEHQLHERMRGRSVIVEDKGFFALLFLNNNYHSVHHAYPGHSWYRLPELFQKNRDRFLSLNDGYFYSNYFEIFKRFALRQKEQVEFTNPVKNSESGRVGERKIQAAE